MPTYPMWQTNSESIYWQVVCVSKPDISDSSEPLRSKTVPNKCTMCSMFVKNDSEQLFKEITEQFLKIKTD